MEYTLTVTYKLVPLFAPPHPPLPSSPFPQGLKTKDLKMGMVVRCGNDPKGAIYTVLEEPGEGPLKVKVLRAIKGHVDREAMIYLDTIGCQPYENGVWNKYNWLREVS